MRTCLHSIAHRLAMLVEAGNCSVLPDSLWGNCSMLTCQACPGVCQEYITHGRSEGGLNDVQQLDSLLRALRVCSQRSSTCFPPRALLSCCAAPCCTCTVAPACSAVCTARRRPLVQHRYTMCRSEHRVCETVGMLWHVQLFRVLSCYASLVGQRPHGTNMLCHMSHICRPASQRWH